MNTPHSGFLIGMVDAYETYYSSLHFDQKTYKDISHVKLSLSKGQTNADLTYKSETESSFRDGGEVRPSNFTIRIWKRVS